MRSKWRWVVLAGVGLAAIGGAVWLRAFRPLVVPVAQTEKNVEVRVFGVGSVEAQVISKIGFQTAGRIVRLSADQGDAVKADAELAALEDSAQRARVAKAQVASAQSDAALVRARAVLERSKAALLQKSAVNRRRQSLVGSGAVTREAADDAQANEAYARSDNEVAEADVLSLEHFPVASSAA